MKIRNKIFKPNFSTKLNRQNKQKTFQRANNFSENRSNYRGKQKPKTVPGSGHTI